MPEAKTSQSHQAPLNLPSLGLSKEPFDLSEPHEVHLLIVEDDEGPRQIPLGGAVYSIGRDPDADIRLFSLFVSRQHATLVRRRREDGKYNYQIIDGNLKGQLSANGISINGRKLQSHDLNNEDVVVFGTKVSAKYYLFKRGDRKTGSVDPFDITLIDPSMIDESEEWDYRKRSGRNGEEPL
jgi:pSer/pThr/pTyr-binding forkhead associated (FHA) protein